MKLEPLEIDGEIVRLDTTDFAQLDLKPIMAKLRGMIEK
jgi:hypothetical protein